MRQARLKYKILEPRILFAADQPADSDASHDQTTTTSSDTTSATPDTSAPAPAPEEAHVVTADGGAPLTESVGTQVTTAAVAVQELVRNFLSGPDGNQILDQIFAGNGTPTADRSARIDAFIAALNAHEIDLRIELVDGSSMLGAYGAFAAKTDQGPTIYLDREWVEGGASQASLVRVITEEFGHFIDQWINGSADTAGDEGEAFALKSLNIQTTQDDWMRILSEDDHFVFHIDGQSVEVETAALIFNNVWNIVDEKAPPAYPTTGIDLEDNSITVGTKLDGASATRYVFQTTNPADPWFSGNNCQGTLYSIDSSNNVIASYFGEMSRLQKSGSIVNAIQFYVYPSGTNTSDPGHSVLVAVGSWTTTQGLSYGTSSDPVSAYLNTLLPTYTAPVASADTGIAFEKGGLNNATVPANNDATGNILSNDSVSGATYSIVNNKLVTTTGSATISSVLNGATGNSATPTSGTTSANGSTVTGAFGTLTIGADGSYKYVVNNSLATVEALRTNSNTLVESFTYTIKDVRGNASTATLSITIKGTNDTPIAADNYNVAKESIESTVANQYSVSDTIGLKATGSVLLNDTDVDGYSETKSIVGLSATATGATDGPTVLSFSGTTSLSNIKAGYYVCTVSGTTYTPLIGANGSQITVATISGSNITLSDTVNLGATGTLRFALKADGSSSGDTVTYTSTAASTGTGVKVSLTTSGYIAAGMTVTGTGVSSGTTVSSVTYDGSGNVTGVTLSQNATIASGTTLTFSSTAGTTITGRYGTLVLASNGTYTYTPFANNSNLNQGQTGVDNFLYTMQDQSAATSQAVLHITVLGSGSTDPNAIADTVSATEAGGLNNGTAGTNPTGSLLTNDTTPTGTKSVTALQAVQSSTVQTLTANSVSYNGTNYDVKATGIYGDFYVKSDGTYVYVVNNSLASVQALKGGATATDSFLYRMSNGTNVDWAAITVTVNGAYDTPVAVADVNSILASQTAVDGYVLMNDTDVDVGDTKTVTKVIAGTGSLPLSNNVASSSTATSNPTSVTGT